MKKTFCTLVFLLMLAYSWVGFGSGTGSTLYAADNNWGESLKSLKAEDNDRAQSVSFLAGLIAWKRLRLHSEMAQDYYNAYALLADGKDVTYPSWKLAENAVYWSPYFTPEIDSKVGRPLESMQEIIESATFERQAYLLTFPDWGPVEFESWPSMQGFVMRTKFQGTNKNTGEVMSFYTHGYVWTNEDGEITRWETWPETYEYDKFLLAAIGDCGPWEYTCQYYAAVLAVFGMPYPGGCPAH